MKKYQYTDPVDNGFTKIKLTRHHHKQVFKNQPLSVFHHYDYYIGDNELILHRTTSLFWKVVITIGFPFVVIWYGISNFKDLLKEYHELYNEKRLGHFISNPYRSSTKTYAAVTRIAKDSGQWG